jgi:hypothetical protein
VIEQDSSGSEGLRAFVLQEEELCGPAFVGFRDPDDQAAGFAGFDGALPVAGDVAAGVGGGGWRGGGLGLD